MHWIRTHWSKISTGLLIAMVCGAGALAAQRYFGDSCCAEGASCCKPKSACCHASGSSNTP